MTRWVLIVGISLVVVGLLVALLFLPGGALACHHVGRQLYENGTPPAGVRWCP